MYVCMYIYIIFFLLFFIIIYLFYEYSYCVRRHDWKWHEKKIVQNVTFFLSFYFIIFILCFNFNMCLVVKVS